MTSCPCPDSRTVFVAGEESYYKAGALTEAARLHKQIMSCKAYTSNSAVTGNVTPCCDMRPQTNITSGASVPPQSVFLQGKQIGCFTELTAADARRIAREALAKGGAPTELTLLENRVNEVLLNSTSPSTPTTRFSMYAGPVIPPACPPTAPPPNYQTPPGCPEWRRRVY